MIARASWVAVTALAIVLGGYSTAAAQDGLPQPSQAPPSDFDADAYVDPNGCGFLRVMVGGQPVWAPRFRSDGSQLCDLAPSVLASAALAQRDANAARAPGIYIQAGAFRLQQSALSVRDGFAARGWGGETRPAGPLTAVFAGPFADEAAAQAALRDIRNEGMPDAFLFQQN